MAQSKDDGVVTKRIRVERKKAGKRKHEVRMEDMVVKSRSSAGNSSAEERNNLRKNADQHFSRRPQSVRHKKD